MARRQKSALDDIFSILVQLPWWVSIVVAVLAFIVLRYIIPMIIATSVNQNIGQGLIGLSKTFAPIFAIFLAALAPVAMVKRWQSKKMFDMQTGIDSIRKLSWKQFEQLLGEYFRRKGYSVEENFDDGADGGVDLRLFANGEKTLVQCKHWKYEKVSVNIVRELFGVMTAERAEHGIVVTSGYFTSDAEQFADNKNLTLIDGKILISIIDSVKNKSNKAIDQQPVPDRQTSEVLCPECGSKMKLKTAQKGFNAGNKFWGCSCYPQCRGTRQFSAE